MRLLAADSAAASGSAANACTAARRGGTRSMRAGSSRQHGLDFVRRVQPCVAQQLAQAVEHEAVDAACGVGGDRAARETASNGELDERRQATAAAGARAGCAARRALRGAGRTDPCRRSGTRPMPQMPTSVSSLSASATLCATGALRQRVAGEARPVVLLDRGGHLRRLAVVLGVIAAHQALQLREFADHVGDEIGLREQRGALAPARGRRPSLAAIAAATARTRVDAVGLRAELVVIDDAARAWAARDSSGCLRSWSKKNLASASRARSTRSLPATIADGSVRLDVAHQQEAVDELAARRRRARSTAGSAASSGSGIPAARRGTRRRTCRRRRPAIRPAP